MRSEIEKAKGFGLAPGEVQAMLAASGGGGGAQPVPPPSNLNARLERGGGRLHAHLHHVDHVRHGRVGRHIDVDLNVPGRGEVGVVVQVLSACMAAASIFSSPTGSVRSQAFALLLAAAVCVRCCLLALICQAPPAHRSVMT